MKVMNKKLRKMKKVTLIFVLGMLISANSFAQLKFGVRAGASVNNIKLKQSELEPVQLSYDQGLGFHFGATSQLQIKKFYIQPEFLFSTVNHDVTLDDIRTNGLRRIGEQRFNEIDIPIMIGFKKNKFKWGVGPLATMVLSSKSELLDKYEMQQKQSSWGYLLGAGFDFDKFNIELRYEGNLSGLGTAMRVGNRQFNFDQRTSQLILTAGYYF